MTKNISHISQRIVCPKCGTQSMRKSLSFKNIEQEFFCDKCHEYFGISELVNIWEYDITDFYTEVGTQLTGLEWLKVAVLDFSNKMAEEEIPSPVDPEGAWSSGAARDESYEVVNRMLAEIEELEWDFDARDLPYPIGAVGSC